MTGSKEQVGEKGGHHGNGQYHNRFILWIGHLRVCTGRAVSAYRPLPPSTKPPFKTNEHSTAIIHADAPLKQFRSNALGSCEFLVSHLASCWDVFAIPSNDQDYVLICGRTYERASAL